MEKQEFTMNKIIIIGAGEIGSRHLQALTRLPTGHHVTIFDPNPLALQRAQGRKDEMDPSEIQSFYTQVMPEAENFNLAIIATMASHRFDAFLRAIECNKIANIIFEKVLFQSLNQIYKCGQILEQKGINAWVNCPRRMMPGYQKIKHQIKPNTALSIKVSGTDYGLACNAIHFIDLFAYLIGDKKIDLIEQNLVPAVHQAKRADCLEVFGNIILSSGNHKLEFDCQKDDGLERIVLDIEFEEGHYQIDEIGGVCQSFGKQVGNINNDEFVLPLQSVMTYQTTLDILQTGQCQLPSYAQSAVLHKVLLNSLIKFFVSVGASEGTLCPIS
jgi:predicted dehydrogenase